MTYQHLAWPGVGHSRKAIVRARSADAAVLKQVRAQPALFKNPSKLQRTLAARIADYDAGLAALRSIKKPR